jgi:hypothetical protein
MRRLVFLALLACQQRTELMVGIATDVRAPDAIDGAELIVTRADNGVTELDVQWSITGVADLPFNLPGSYGVFASDGTPIQLDLVLLGTKGNTTVVTRHAVLGLISDQTLFYRMGITAGCASKTDCAPTETCVEGTCQDPHVDPRTLPPFTDDLVTSVACNSGTSFIDTGTGQPMPENDGGGDCPAGLCSEGTCFNPPPPPDPTQTRTVLGAEITTFVLANGTQSAIPVDLSTVPVQATLPDGTVLLGNGSSDGTFAVAAVPEGPYTLQVGARQHATSATSVDLSTDFVGRPDVVRTTMPTSITLNLTNLDPWVSGDGDVLEPISANADAWYEFIEDAVPITDGATSLSGYTFDSTMGFDSTPTPTTLGLIDAGKGDHFEIHQLHTQTTSTGFTYQGVTKTFVMPITQTDGGTTVVSGAMTAVPQDHMLSVHVDGSIAAQIGFDGTNATLLNPRCSAQPGTGGIELFASVEGNIGGNGFGVIGATADYLISKVGFAAADTGVMTYGVPTVPGDVWGLMFDEGFVGVVQVIAPGAVNPTFFGCGFRAHHDLATVGTTATVAVEVGPVQNATIDGRDLFAQQGLGSPTPTLSWQPPAIASSRLVYTVLLFQLGVNGMRTVKTKVAALTTTETSVTVPPGVLMKGQLYVATITASATPNPDAPDRSRLPEASSTIVSGVLTSP